MGIPLKNISEKKKSLSGNFNVMVKRSPNFNSMNKESSQKIKQMIEQRAKYLNLAAQKLKYSLSVEEMNEMDYNELVNLRKK